MPKAKLRVGFDLDGVILYNPARVARPIIVLAKKLLKKNQDKFHLPTNKTQEVIWRFLHRSSLFISPGLEDIKKLVKSGKIDAYIISARYEFLKKDFVAWLNKIDANKYFVKAFYNDDNEQPYVFKEKVIRKLKLDFFVEDNWDVVRNLNAKKVDTKIFWIFNILDSGIKYPYKFSTLKKAVEFLKKSL